MDNTLAQPAVCYLHVVHQFLLACVHFERGDLKQAESMLQESLDLQREIFRTEPEFLRGVSTVLCNIAFVHAKNGAFPKALIELEGALQIRQDILLEDSSTGDITENMAYILAIHQLQHGSGNIDDVSLLATMCALSWTEFSEQFVSYFA